MRQNENKPARKRKVRTKIERENESNAIELPIPLTGQYCTASVRDQSGEQYSLAPSETWTRPAPQTRQKIRTTIPALCNPGFPYHCEGISVLRAPAELHYLYSSHRFVETTWKCMSGQKTSAIRFYMEPAQSYPFVARWTTSS